MLSAVIPPLQSPDEFDHIKRAAGLLSGQILVTTQPGNYPGLWVDDGLLLFMQVYDRLPFRTGTRVNMSLCATLAIGDEVVLRVTIPCPRCLTMTLPQGDLPHDPGILRTVAQHSMREVGEFGTLPSAGVYADVLKSGTIRRGAALHLLD
jgi:hypothetical protein